MTEKSVEKFRVNPDKNTLEKSITDGIMAKSVVFTARSPESQEQADLLSDVFLGAFQEVPELSEEPPYGREVNYALMRWAIESGSLDKARNDRSLLNAVVAAPIMWEVMMRDETLKEAMERQEEANKKLQEAEQRLQDAMSHNEDGNSRAVAAAAESYKEAMQEYNEQTSNAVELIEQAQDDPMTNAVMSVAGKEAGKEGAKAVSVCKGWGLDPGGINTMSGVEEIMKEISDDKAEMIAQILGRLRGISASVMSESKTTSFSPTGEIAFVKKIIDIFPAHRIYMSSKAHPVVRAKTIQKWSDSGLLGTRPVNQQEESGSFVMYIDESGSMGGTLTAICKALAMGIAQATQAELERSYELYGFSSTVMEDQGVTEKSSWAEHMAWAKRYAAGGTSFDSTFKSATKRLRAMKDDGVDNADFVLLTDGVCYLSADQRQEWVESDSRLIYIQLGGRENQEITEIAHVSIVTTENDFRKQIDDICEQVSEVIARR